MSKGRNFYNLHEHGFLRVATATPNVVVADPVSNGAATLDLLEKAHDDNVSLVIFPELGISGYTLDDLFFQDAVLDACEAVLGELVEASLKLAPVFVVGMPLRVNSLLYNVAITIHRGVILGVTPKMYLPNYREFYEHRQFTAGTNINTDTILLAGQDAPFGDDLIFQASDVADFTFGVEVCEDVWVPVPPSSYTCLLYTSPSPRDKRQSRMPSSA